MMKLKISVNFDFGKLANRMDSIIGDYISNYANNAEEGTKNNIDRRVGADGRSLKLGKGSYRYGQQALYNTGAMYKSIKGDKDRISIKQYGYMHNQGKFPVKQGTNVKNFIGTTKGSETKLNKKFMDSVNKTLRSNKVIASF